MPGPPASRRGAGGGDADRQRLGLAVPRAARASSASAMLAQRARDNLCARRVLQPRRRPGRARSSTGTRSSSTTRATCSRGRRSSPRRCSSRRSTCRPRSTARLRDTRLRPPARARCREVRHLGRFDRPDAARRPRALGGDVAGCSSRRPRSTRRSCSARATTSRRTASSTSCIGLSGGIDSTLVALVAVDALGADRVHLP